MVVLVRRGGHGNRGGRPLALALLTLAVGLALSGLAAWLQGRSNDARAAAEFDALAGDATHSLFARFRIYEYGLRGLRGAILTAGGEDITPELFRIYHQSRDIAAEFPGARGFGFIRRVRPDQEPALLEALRRGGLPDFQLRQLAPHDRERYVIQYIEPIERNRAALGLDIGSEPNRRAAADLALRTGSAAITRPITLVQAPEDHLRGFLILLPIFRPGLPIETEAQRHTAAFGWSYVPIVLTEVLAGFDFGGGAVGMSLYDGDGADGPPERFYGPPAPAEAAESPLLRRIVEPIFGRTWQVELWPQPEFFDRLGLLHPPVVFAIGAVISSLLAALLYAFLLNAGRRRQLIADQLRLATLVENSSDAILTENLDGVITGWNRAAERIFGYRADEAIGRPSAEVVPSIESDRAIESMIRTVSRGDAIEPFDQVCRRRDGSVVEISTTASPITAADGRVIGMGKMIRDVGARKEAQRQLQEFNTRLEREVGERTAQLETARRDLQTILDTLPSMIGYWDTRYLCRFANRAYHAWFGVDPHSLPGRHMRDLLGEKLFAANQPYIEAALRGEPQRFERTIPRPDGTGVRHSLAHYIPDIVGRKVRGFYVLIHDVTELTESRQKLAAVIRENEALLRTIQSHVLYSVTDPRGRILDINEVFCRIAGYERDELIGKTHQLFRSGVHPDEFYADMWTTLESGRAWRGEICNRARDGSLFWSDTVIAPFFGEDGKIEKYVAIRKDITARKEAIRELEIERQRLDNILRGTNAGTWEWNVQTGEARFNERWAELLGYTLEELAPASIATWTERTHPDDLALSNTLLARHFVGELDHYECEVRVRHRSGRWLWVLDRGRVTSWRPDGKPEWMYGTRQDISRRKEAERRLAASEAFLERAGRIARVGGWQMDLESGEFTWTQQTASLLEVPPGYQPTLQGALDFYAPDTRPKILAALAELRARGGGFDVELPLITATGRRIWVRTIGEAECAADGGRPLRLSGAIQDISARHIADKALREAMRAAEAASAAKSAFLANMSHEIRTPLNAILGLAHLLDRSSMDEEQQRLISALRLAGQGLLGIVNDVLDLAKIEAGGLSLDVAPFGPREMLDELRTMFEPQARAKRLALTLEAGAELPAVVEGDAARVRQVLVNLLSNAVKFTEEGEIRITAAVTERTDRQIRVRVAVRDTGVGIPAEAQARLFTPFTQADVSTTRRHGGTGLGLSIVRRLVEKMGGEVGFMSAVDRGSEFWIVLPLGLPAAPAELRPAAPATRGAPRLAGARILVVDDNDVNRTVASRILVGEGAVVTTGATGLAALENLRAAPGGFDVVLMDIQMPQMDGVEATRRIRGELGLTELPIIALTAGALVAERRRSIEAGMSAFLTKPLDPDTMIRVVQRHLREGRANDDAAAT